MNKTLNSTELEWMREAVYQPPFNLSSEIQCTITLLNEELLRLIISPIAEYSLTDTDGQHVFVFPENLDTQRPQLESFLIKHNLKKKQIEDFIFNLSQECYIKR